MTLTRPRLVAPLGAILGAVLLVLIAPSHPASAADAAAAAATVAAAGPKGPEVVTSVPNTPANPGSQAKFEALIERQRILAAAARLPLPVRGVPQEAARLRAQLEAAPARPKSILAIPVQAGPVHSIKPLPAPMTPEDAVRPMPALDPTATPAAKEGDHAR